MKAITLLAAILLVVNTTNASVSIKSDEDHKNNKWNCNEPISFVERGIEFLVFPNGEFDFNTCPQNSQINYFYKTAGRRSASVQVNMPVNYGVSIEHDAFGRVRRVGNVCINYDNRDRVNRIGNVYMKYNRFALTHIGGMQIVYNYRGEMMDRIGYINECVGHYNYACNNNYHDYDNNHRDNYYAPKHHDNGHHYGRKNKK